MKVRIVADHIISPLGFGSQTQFNAILNGQSAIREIEDPLIWPDPFFGATFTKSQINQLSEGTEGKKLSILENAMALAISEVAQKANIDLCHPDTAIILASTKGNIDRLKDEVNEPSDSLLFQLARNIGDYFGCADSPLLISNACISGLLAVIIAARMLEAGHCKNAVVCGGDLLTRFTLSGFQSFKAVSANPCKPFDAQRDGITLGEAVGAVAMQRSNDELAPFYIAGASANDANHISGPSRTGEGLFQAIQRTIADDSLPDMISAHGTATLFNDEMECQAFNRAGLHEVPLHSLKGVFGHTLGAAGIVELIVALAAMKEGQLLPTIGYEDHGVSKPLNVTRKASATNISRLLKTSSGFGGCNGAALFGI